MGAYQLSFFLLLQVECELSSVILNDSFAAKIAQSKGRQMLDLCPHLDPGVAEAKHDDGLSSPSQTSLRPPESTQNAHAPAPQNSVTRAAQPRTGSAAAVAEETMEEDGVTLIEPLLSHVTSESMLASPQVVASKAMDPEDDQVLIGASQQRFEALQASVTGMHSSIHAMHEAMENTLHNSTHATHERLDVFMATMTTMSERLAAIERAIERQPPPPAAD